MTGTTDPLTANPRHGTVICFVATQQNLPGATAAWLKATSPRQVARSRGCHFLDAGCRVVWRALSWPAPADARAIVAPADVVEKLNAEINKTLSSTEKNRFRES